MTSNPTSPEKDVQAVLLKTRTFRRKPGDIPYPVKHSNGMSNFDIWDNMFFHTWCKGLTMHHFEKPPMTVLDLGCGSGFWAIQAAKQWTTTSIVGYDFQNIQPNLFSSKEHEDIPSRVRWVHGNLLEGLPFPSSHFDYVRLAGIGLGVPEDEWQYVLEDIARVMKSGAIIEVIEEDPIFPCASTSYPPRPLLPPLRPRLDLPWALQDSLASPFSDSSSTLFSDAPSVTSDERTEVLSSKSTISLKTISPTTPGPKSPVGFPPPSPQQTQRLPPVPETNLVPDPRDHARLKAAWEAMLSHRFLATKLLSVLPFYLSSIFIDIRINPPLKVHLPPNSAKQGTTNSVSIDRVTSLDSPLETHLPSPRSSANYSSSLTEPFSSPWPTMHLARNVETVKGCKEAMWQEYEKLFPAYVTPTVNRTELPESVATRLEKRSAREIFDIEWSDWENDMADRIAMRGSLSSQLAWPEPPGERPDWRVWRSVLNNVEPIERRTSGSSTSSQSSEQPDLCRSISNFMGYKR